jgi:hypothetical protein
MTDTPKTDAVCGATPLDHVENLKRLARRLERELSETRNVAIALRDWVDAVPQDVVLPAMPGVDRDWVDSILANRNLVQPAKFKNGHPTK